MKVLHRSSPVSLASYHIYARNNQPPDEKRLLDIREALELVIGLSRLCFRRTIRIDSIESRSLGPGERIHRHLSM